MRPRIGIFAYARVSGGQRLAIEMGRALAAVGDVTLLGHQPMSKAMLRRMHGDPLPFRVEGLRHASMTSSGEEAMSLRIRAVSAWSARFDLFVDCVAVGPPVRPLARHAIYLCYFPIQSLREVPYLSEYQAVVAISRYTAAWMGKRWGESPTHLIYPPASLQVLPARREPMVLSVARFDANSMKRHDALIAAWRRLCGRRPDIARRWRLVLAGSREADPSWLAGIRALARVGPGRIEVRDDVDRRAIRGLYSRASVFWHLCGLGLWKPELREHFGIATVEAMQAGAVPVVFDAGGQSELFTQGREGFLIRSVDALVRRTESLIDDPSLRSEMSRAAQVRAKAFSPARFSAEVQALACRLLSGPPAPKRPLPSREACMAAMAPDTARWLGPWHDERFRKGGREVLARRRIRFEGRLPEPGPCGLKVRVSGRILRRRFHARSRVLSGVLRFREEAWLGEPMLSSLPRYDGVAPPVHGPSWRTLSSLGPGWRREGSALVFHGEGRATLQSGNTGLLKLDLAVSSVRGGVVEILAEGRRLARVTLERGQARRLSFPVLTEDGRVRVRLTTSGGAVRVRRLTLAADARGKARLRGLAELIDRTI